MEEKTNEYKIACPHFNSSVLLLNVLRSRARKTRPYFQLPGLAAIYDLQN